MTEIDDVGRWWQPQRPSADVAQRLAEIALVRAQVFLPIVLFGIVVGLIVSEPTGIPLTGSILVVNALTIGCAVWVWSALRRGRIRASQAHAVGALLWLLTPVTTLTSMLINDAAMLTLPLMIELASLAVMIETRWAFAASVPVLVAGLALMARSGTSGIFVVAVIGVWVVGLFMQVALRRSLIRAETHRLNLVSALEALKRELAERQRAEADREQLRDQFVHAQRMDAVGTLSAGLAHDMNNILGGILAFAEILRAEATDPQVREDLDRIRQEAERGAALTRGLLAFSRKGAYRRRAIALGSVLDDMMPLLARSLGKHVQIERVDGPLAIVDGDPAQLGQVLINLCLNAADAMDGKGSISITTEVVEHAGKTHARLSVSDTGVGMDEATQKRMFEPFFTTKPVGKGTGLGLAMVYGAIEAHGGTIEVVSAPGQGTTIQVLLPLTEAAPDARKRARTDPRGRSGAVMIVDDEAMMREGVARMVDHLGLSAVLASDGDDALRLYGEHADDVVLVLLDMVMPRVGGAECFRALRERTATPIVLMSGYTDDTAAQELLAAGANGFLEKPFTVEQLGAELDRVLGRAPADSPP